MDGHLSGFIEELQQLKAEHGDIIVLNADEQYPSLSFSAADPAEGVDEDAIVIE